ncbi:hypothetical protein JKP88DRAFT_285109 [Tribonema minus]|uniref:F-box domain-containing protein n=1 Tax=Tribonema minus TaxID=303371 RepID=A0A835ZEP0_9STRA|nr:hypothetical protein JKP88DRAFT_285109 [Tribonema minus]
MRQTRRRSQLQVEAKTFLPDEVVARVSSFLPLRSVLRAGLACKRWRAAISHRSVSWTTAMWELDPFAVMGPAGVIQAAAHLSGSWLQLARRLGNPTCRDAWRCPNKAFYFNKKTLLRACRQHRQGDHEMLMNDFLYDTKPSFCVNSSKALLAALAACHDGACIRVAAPISVGETLYVRLCRLQGHPPVERCCNEGAPCNRGAKPTLHLKHGSLAPLCAIVEGLRIEAGSRWLNGESWGPGAFFPAVSAAIPNGGLLRRCDVVSYQGSALVANSGGIVAEHCTLSTDGVFLGAVVRNAEDEKRPAIGGAGTLSMRGCSVMDNQWGAFLGKDAPADVTRAVLAANTFGHNRHEDIAELYHYAGQRVQPWRRGWDDGKP